MNIRILRAFALHRSLYALALAALLSAGAAPARADSEEHEAAAEAEHGHHGRTTLHDIVTGEESLSFWGSVVNFSLLVYLLARFGKKPLSGFLEGRRESIERGIREASEVKRSAEAAFNTYNERLKTLDDELAKLRKEVASAAERERERISAEANETVSRFSAETETLIQRQTEQLEAQIRREVVAAAAEAAERAVREVTTPEDQQRLADTFMRELSKVADRSSTGKRA